LDSASSSFGLSSRRRDGPTERVMNRTCRVLFPLLLATLSCAAPRSAPRAARTERGMEVQLLRSATVVVSHEIAGGTRRRLLIDPVLADPGTEAPIPYSNALNNPRVALPVDKRQVLASVDAVLITHAHSDHFDQEAERILPKHT
jgi:hypothetical protein